MGHQYRPWRIRRGHSLSGTIIHRVKPPVGIYEQIDFTGQEYMSLETFRLWVLLGKPTREDFGRQNPLNAAVILKLKEVSHRYNIPLGNLTLLRVTERLTRR